MIVDVIAVNETGWGHFTIYPANISRPGTSNVNWTPGVTANNLDLAATGGGTFNIDNASSGTTDVVVDCFGYFSVG